MAHALTQLERDYEAKVLNTSTKEGYDSDEDSADQESLQASAKHHNGSVTPEVDRYGFCGGDQYTDPSRYKISVYTIISRNKI